MTCETAFFCGSENTVKMVYGPAWASRPGVSVFPEIINLKNFERHLPELVEVKSIFSTWGMPPLTIEQVRLMPELRVLFYGAGSVRHFAEPLMDCGVKVVSAWQMNGKAVAEYAFAQILLAGKGFFRSCRLCSAAPEKRKEAHSAVNNGNYGAFTGIIGAGAIGRAVMSLISKNTDLKILLFDPFVSEEQARSMGAEKVSLEDCFARSQVVSNHAPNIPATRGMITGAHFRLMPQKAVFINTGRGATVRENEMIDVLRERPDLSAVLDVTDPEPPVNDSPFYGMPNVFLTPHIAGAMNNECLRMGDFMLEEFQNWRAGKPLRAEVTRKMLENMA